MTALLNSFNNSEWCGPIGAAVIILLLVLFFSGTGEQARAYTNRIRYWAKGGPDGPQDAGNVRVEKYADSAPGMIEDVSHRGRVSKSQRCHKCHMQMNENRRMLFADRSAFVEYRCPKCRDKRLIKYR